MRQQSELAYLSRNEQHGRTVFTSCYASSATDTSSRVHSLVGIDFRDRNCVGILCTARVYRDISSGLLYFVECTTVYHQVANNGESGRTPRFYGDYVSVVEFTHVQLASGNAGVGPVGVSVDIERTHTANTFAAIVVEYYRLFAFVNQLLVEQVEHFEERAACRYVFYAIFDELAGLFGTTLTPNLQIYIDCCFHKYWSELSGGSRASESKLSGRRLLRGCFYDL